MTNTFIEKFQSQCTNYFTTRLSSSSSILTDQTTSEYYLNEYKRCIDEQINVVNYLTEQIESLNSLKSYEMALDTLSEHLQAAHEYEIKQNELFEQILRELTTNNPSSKDERRRLLNQIDELMIQKANLTNKTNQLIQRKQPKQTIELSKDILQMLLLEYITGFFFISIKFISGQGLACYTCTTTDPNNDNCQDPFSSILNTIQNNCQATSKGKNGTFPARFCVKISGRVISVEDGGNVSYRNTQIYYRTCVVDNIMESTKSLETSGNFRLKGLNSMPGSIRLQGFMSLCTFDGCNHARTFHSSILIIVINVLLTISIIHCSY